MICKICNKEFPDNRTLGVHIRKAHHMSTEEYYVTYIDSRPAICVTDGKNPTKFISLTQGFRKHCCNKCAQLDPIVANAREEGCIKQYGYSNVMKNPDICSQAINTRMENNTNLANDNNLTAITQSDDYMLSRICNIIGIEIIKIGQKCFVRNEDYDKLMMFYEAWKSGNSVFELQIIEEIKSIYKGTIDIHNKEIISPKEIDVYLPKLNLGFEINGNYRHSKDFKDKYYHINKTNLCKDKNIRLVHIFEYEWIDNKDNVRQIIADAISNKTKNDKVLTLDLSKESLLSYPTYTTIKILEPILINNIYNCGYAIIENNNNVL